MELRPFTEYSKAYPNVQVERSPDGILELRMHTEGSSLLWGQPAHDQLTNLYAEIALDTANKVVILTGTGEHFIGGMKAERLATVERSEGGDGEFRANPHRFAELHYQGKRIMQALLDIEVPMIAAVNGSVAVHSEQALFCDVVLAADTAAFRDGVHFAVGLIPGDGIHVIYHEAMGVNRARYFLLTGQELTAQQALEYGLVNEVLPAERLLDRARELAHTILERPPLVVRLTRQILVQDLKKRLLDEVGYGLALENYAATQFFPPRS